MDLWEEREKKGRHYQQQQGKEKQAHLDKIT